MKAPTRSPADFEYSAPATTVRRGDTRKFRRYGAAATMLLAPLSIALVRASVPVVEPGSAVTGTEAMSQMAANAGRARLTFVLSVAAVLVLPLGMVALMRLVSRRSPVLGAVGGGLALVGWAMVPVLVVSDVIAYEMSRLDPASTQFAQLWERIQGNPTMAALGAVFVLGHVVGMLLLAIGLGRGQLVPKWAAVAVAVGTLVHPVAIMALSSRPLDVLAHCLVVAGLVPAAARALRMSDDEWDLPPAAG